MDTRVAVISIIVEDSDSIETLNQLLYDARDHIIGRMGIPYREKGISIISIAIDASQDIISALSGKIGRLKGVSTKTAYSNVITHTDVPEYEDGDNVKRRNRKIYHRFQRGSSPCRKGHDCDADRLRSEGGFYDSAASWQRNAHST